jgi:hypothetical protein
MLRCLTFCRVLFVCVALRRTVAGVLGLYRGFLPVMFCRMSNYAYFGAYEVWKGVYAQFIQPSSSGASAGGVGQKPTKVAAIFAGGMSGISYWLSCYPLDVVKVGITLTHSCLAHPMGAVMLSACRLCLTCARVFSACVCTWPL